MYSSREQGLRCNCAMYNCRGAMILVQEYFNISSKMGIGEQYAINNIKYIKGFLT